MLKHFDHLFNTRSRKRAGSPGELDDKLCDRHLQLIVSASKELEPWLNGN
jgi:hypothetical protein